MAKGSKIAKALMKRLKLAGRKSVADFEPTFKVGRTRNLTGKADEYARQLRRQLDGLNNMTADELLKNLDEVRRGGLAQKQARKTFHAELIDTEAMKLITDADYARAMKAVHPHAKDVDDLAKSIADDKMRALAALHEPDIVAGGYDLIGIGPDGLPSMGDKYVNSSIGSQWKNVRDALREYLEGMVATNRGGEKVNVGAILKL